MKIILLIFAAIQVTTLQGLPMTCKDRIINRFMVMMPSPNVEGEWVFFPWPVHKTVIVNGMTGSGEDLVVKNEYEKDDLWSKMDGKWMAEIRDFIMSKYKLSSSKIFKENLGLVGQKNAEKSEYLSKKDGEWIQEIKEYFKNKYLLPFKFIKGGSNTSELKEKSKKVDYWSNMDGKWAQEIKDYFKDRFSSSEESDKSSEKDKISSTSASAERKESQEIMQELSQEINESSKLEQLEKSKLEQLQKEESSSEEGNSLSQADLPNEIKERLEEIGLSQGEEQSTLNKETVDETENPRPPSYNEDGSIMMDISKYIKENGGGKYKPKKIKMKIKGKFVTFPHEFPTAPSKNGKTQTSEESDGKSNESFEKQEKGQDEKFSGISTSEVEKLSVVDLDKNNGMEGEALVPPQNIAESSNEEKSSEESGEFENNFQGCGKLKKFKKYKIPYGLAKKFPQDQDIGEAGKWSMKQKKRFTSV